MIGNDIVDLAIAKKDSNWKRRGFLDKIFTTTEQILIKDAQDQDLMVWNLWSRKEAAYKIYNRETSVRAYIPLQLECVFENTTSGKVICNGKTYRTTTVISRDKIHTIALGEELCFSGIEFLKSCDQVIKKKGLPYHVDTHKNTIRPVSVSHHGRFSATVAHSLLT